MERKDGRMEGWKEGGKERWREDWEGRKEAVDLAFALALGCWHDINI